jgi:hypothetical protein
MPRVEMEVGPVLNMVDESKYDVWGVHKFNKSVRLIGFQYGTLM